MPNSKTLDSTGPPPRAQRGWIRKSELDDFRSCHLPVPTQVISNEEYAPPPQTRDQRAVEQTLLSLATRCAGSLRMDRRTFLRTSCGLAAAFAALNSVFGRFFAVEAAELYEPAARRLPGYFIFDVQTHHVEAHRTPTPADQKFLDYLVMVRRFGGNWNPRLQDRDSALDELYRQNYIKEIFLDSETDMAVVSGLPQMTPDSYVISPDEMVKTRSWVNELTGSRRVISHGVLSPELGERNRDAMRAQVEKLKIEAWKGYPGQPLGPNGDGWWLDDEKTAYPALELSRQLGVKNICLHKGLPAPDFSAEHCHPRDVFRAAVDFPDLNFLLYHAGFRGLTRELMEEAAAGFQTSSYVPWVSDVCEWKKQHPEVSNVYMELGSTFGMLVITSPLLCAHVLGMILDAFGDDHVLWGTDSIWWGSPQWQIEALKRFEMPAALAERFGYAPLTTAVKRKIFGLNAARVYGVDPAAARRPLPEDYIDRLKKLYDQAGLASPSNTQYGWVRAPDPQADHAALP